MRVQLALKQGSLLELQNTPSLPSLRSQAVCPGTRSQSADQS